jgi:hypothetical protein
MRVHQMLIVLVHGLLVPQIVSTQRILFLFSNQDKVQIVKQQRVIQYRVMQAMESVHPIFLVWVIGLLALMLVN